MTFADADVCFNVVLTGTTFDQLQLFLSSQLAHSGARYRLIANACPPRQVTAMRAYAEQHEGRVVEVRVVSTDRMVPHGEALDEVLRTSDDGDLFAFIDPDICASGPFLGPFLEVLGDAAAVTSGKEVWSDDNIRPPDHPGVNGEYFFDQDGFVFGSPHLAIYRRRPLEATIERWAAGFGSRGNDVSDAVRDRLVELGRSYWVYDTAKIVNILLQGDGQRLVHQEHPALLHVGGVSHFLAPPSSAPAAAGRPPRWGEGPDWGDQPGMAARYGVARYAAAVLDDLERGAEAPPVPSDAPPSLRPKLTTTRSTLVKLMADHGAMAAEPR